MAPVAVSGPPGEVAWWSFTKTLTAALALRLEEAGALALDRTLAGVPYTMRQLLQHRAGLGDYGSDAAYHEAVAAAEPPWTEDELFRRYPPERLLFAPDGGWAYSNVGYAVVRRELERLSGTEFGSLLAREVLTPLGVHARLARTAAEMGAIALPPPHRYDPGWVFHGVVIGRVEEAAQALDGILHGSLLSDASRRKMLAVHPIGGPVPGRPWRTAGYGLGLMIGTLADVHGSMAVAGHSAGGPGSVGAVYGALDGSASVAAVFVPGADEGVAEREALTLLRRP